MAGTWGKFLSFWEVLIFCRVRLRARLAGAEAVREYVLHECRQAESRHSCKALYCRERPMCRSVPIESKIGRGKKTLEGESPLLKDGALSLQTSLTHRELPPCPRRLRSEDLFRFGKMAGTWGKFLSFWEVLIFCRVRLRTRLVGAEAVREYVLHECRDSACRRPFGV